MSIFPGKQIYRDIRLIALLRILSCFLEASAALLGQAQVCILLAHQQSLAEPEICQIPRHPIALLRILSCFLEASAALLAGLHPEPCRALNVSVFLLNNCAGTSADCFAQDTELLFGSQCRASWASAGLHSSGASQIPAKWP